MTAADQQCCTLFYRNSEGVRERRKRVRGREKGIERWRGRWWDREKEG